MISAYLRINKREEEALLEISKELNIQRLQNGERVVKESEILHQILEQALKKTKVIDRKIVVE